MHLWAGAVFLDGVSPVSMGYSELRYFHEWHMVEVAAIKAAQSK